MEITTTYKAVDRTAWRSWLEQHHATTKEIWLLFDDVPEALTISYLDAVEEAICFGWIDSVQKRFSTHERVQRFTPRKKRSNWTELNKERACRLVRLGMMTDAGFATLPDLTAKFKVPKDIVEALKAEPDAWSNFLTFPALYRRVRIGYIEKIRKNQSEFERRLRNFVNKTARNQMFGNWNDQGRLI
ncbi:YdeI/OmpD-associated family protein [Leptolyngbya sp. FACHB-321]|uniref:YdeI/OmpD-associated family protein n=1 Tax=Leptolyngbya sp. FACHB-321 TaxID=2692807 RepID=UPI00168290B5|nr:YdeI/OmpD-associated family protein [Leptolyngbya sp. FACHB-321]MBD2034470.1 YdeI/OmpD-associated family protein [Leptolyngbya sp. FACHB-321]